MKLYELLNKFSNINIFYFLDTINFLEIFVKKIIAVFLLFWQYQRSLSFQSKATTKFEVEDNLDAQFNARCH